MGSAETPEPATAACPDTDLNCGGAIGSPDAEGLPPADPPAGTQLSCTESEDPNCEVRNDTPMGEQPQPDVDVEFARQQTQELLGAAETELPDDVRVARRGEETFMLMEDYVAGRITVELDDHGGTYVVTTATGGAT